MNPDYLKRLQATPGSPLPPAFAFAVNAVRDAGYRETWDPYDWVPVAVLYDAYYKAWSSRLMPQPGDLDPELLDKRNFGVMLSLAFPDCGKCKRWANKRQVRGREGMTGPDAQRTDDIRY